MSVKMWLVMLTLPLTLFPLALILWWLGRRSSS